MTLSPASSFDYIRGHALLGASTGFMADDRGDWPRLLDRCLGWSDAAVELSALSAPELDPLLAFLAQRDGRPLPFGYVSVHGPTKGWSAPTEALVTELRRLPAQVESVILHPDTIEDVDALRPLGPLVVLENLDHRPTTGRTVAELAPFFDALPEAGFCFDIAHITAMPDPWQLGHDLLDAFGGRLRQVHVSSFIRDGAKHVALRDEDARDFAQLLKRCRGVPWILEAAIASEDGEAAGCQTQI